MGLLKKLLRSFGKEKQKYNWHTIEGREYAYLRQFNDAVERELIQAGIEEIPIEIAKSIVSIYRDIYNIEVGCLIRKLIPPHREYCPGRTDPIPGDSCAIIDAGRDVWHTAEDIRKTYRRDLSEELGKITDEQYERLPKRLKKVVDKGREIVL